MINLLLEQLLRIVHVVFKIHLPEKILILWILIGSHLLLFNSCPTKKVNAVYLFSAGYSFEVIWHNDCYRQTAGGGQPHLHHRQSRPLLESTQWTAASHGTVIYLSSNKTKSFNLWYRGQNSHLNHRLLLRLIQSDSCCCSRFLATRDQKPHQNKFTQLLSINILLTNTSGGQYWFPQNYCHLCYVLDMQKAI